VISDGIKKNKHKCVIHTLAAVVMVWAIGEFLCNTITLALPGSVLAIVEATLFTVGTVRTAFALAWLVSDDICCLCCCCCS